MTAIELHNTLPAVPAEQSPDDKRRNDDLRAHRAMGLLMHVIPLNMPFTSWRIDSTGIEALYNIHAHNVSNDQAHVDMRRLAKGLDGFEYTSRPHGNGKDKVSAIGSIGGVRVDLWVLLDPCTCHCHTEGGAR